MGCRFNDLQPVHLSGLTKLAVLHLIECDISEMEVPSAWSELLELHLSGNRLTRLPSNLTALTSLYELSVNDQRADFQLREPLVFFSAMLLLQELDLTPHNDHPWDPISQFVLMEARMLIKRSPYCMVDLQG